MKTLLTFALTGLFALTLADARAEEKNGVGVTVSKTTIDNNDRQGSYSKSINRTQALKAVVKNVGFKPLAESELTWTILIKRYYSSYYSSSSSYGNRLTGKEKIKALKPAETAEFILGSAQISGYQGSSWAEKDKIEWQIVVTQGATELIKTQSTQNFDALNKQARGQSGGGVSRSGND